MSDPTPRGVITQGTIAEFMRKRTQLVGFSFGHFKHVQYMVEFLDNALDAIESARWRYGAYTFEDEHVTLQYTKSQKEDLFIDEGSDADALASESGNGDLDSVPENGDSDSSEEEIELFLNPSDQDIGITTLSMENLISPIREHLNTEPVVVIRLQEMDLDQLASLTGTGAPNERMYCFEVFDNGVGLIPEDLEKFGHYLASSKSEKLKQTRGSQGFGAPSAFSDAQNTTGKPITVLSKHILEEQATISVFYTTGRNLKKYVVDPNLVDVSFPHGTYIRLYFLNVPYRKGFVDTYIRRTSLLNAHITLIYIDPRDRVMVFNRRVHSFPPESTYAKPHPTSVSIGDFKEIVRTSTASSLETLFEDSFSRISRSKTRTIIDAAQLELNSRGTGLFTMAPQDVSPEQAKILLQVLSQRDPCPYYLSFSQFHSTLSSTANGSILELLTSSFPDLSKPDARRVLYKSEVDPEQSTPISKAAAKRIHQNVKGLKACAAEITLDQLTALLKLSKSSNIINFLSNTFCSMTRSNAKEIINLVDIQLGYTSLQSKLPRDLTEDEISMLFQNLKQLPPPESDSDQTRPDLDRIEFTTMIQTSTRQSLSSFLSNELKLSGTQVRSVLKETETQLDYFSLLVKAPKHYSEPEINILFQLLKQHSQCFGTYTKPNSLLSILHASPASSLPEWLEKHLNIPHDEANILLDEASQLLDLGGVRPLNLVPPRELPDEQINILYRAFRAQKYYAPPTDTVVPVGDEIMNHVIQTTYSPDFVETETRKPTSGKGLAFVVEATIAYGGNISEAKTARDVLYRFVNRTPKLRDNSDCAIWKATAAVNWKNYGVDQFDNGLPKGPIRIFISISGPFVHVMFKTQSKQALAEDETLLTEIKLALEMVARRLKIFISKRVSARQRKRRASLLRQYAASFARSVSSVISTFPENDLPSEKEIHARIVAAIDEITAADEPSAGSEDEAEELPSPEPPSVESNGVET